MHWVCTGPLQCEALCVAFSRGLCLWVMLAGPQHHSVLLQLSLGCELMLQLVKGSLGTPDALLSRVHVDRFLGWQGWGLDCGFKPILCKLLKVHSRCLDALLQ